MDSAKWRISKACQECRAKKIKCNGEEPCQRCKIRGFECVYRQKARNRMRKHQLATVAGSTSPPSDEGKASLPAPTVTSKRTQGRDSQPCGGGSPSIHIHSVAATHRASPSCFLQLYYGPSSNFSMLQSIYHQIEGTRPASESREEVEEAGPGLDLFSNRRLFFGDLADSKRSAASASNDSLAMFLDSALSYRLMERYLSTYWHILPIFPKEEYRRRLDELTASRGVFSFERSEDIVLMLAMALGACMLDEGRVADFLYHKAKQGAATLDDQAERARPNAAFISAGTAVRRAVAAGLHKDVSIRGGQTPDDVYQRRIAFWSLYFWETWICFSLGRPTSIPEPDANMPEPTNEVFLLSLVKLARLMSKCATRIYNQNHKSLLPLWNAGNEIRRELLQFAEQQRKDMHFGLVGDPSTGELGVCQTIISTMYHHTLLLTFRPFLVLRAKLRHETASARRDGASHPTPPPWLDTACEYCLDAARHSIGFLAGACEQNVYCKEIRYHGFFLEGACYALAFDMLDSRASCEVNFPWIKTGLGCLKNLLRKDKVFPDQTPVVMAAIERMLRSAMPDFQLQSPLQEPLPLPLPSSRTVLIPPTPAPTNTTTAAAAASPATESPMMMSEAVGRLGPTYLYPTMPFGFDANGPPPVAATSPIPSGDQVFDLTMEDMGWNYDFATMDMEAFLSIDANQDLNLGT